MYSIYRKNTLIHQSGETGNLLLFNPKLTVEMGKAGSLEFQIPPSNSSYNNLDPLKTYIRVEDDGEEIFRGRVLSNKRNFNNLRDIYIEGDLAYLVDTVQKGEKYDGKKKDGKGTDAFFKKLINNHNSQLGGTSYGDARKFTVGTIDENLIRDIFVAGKSDADQDVYDNVETKDFNYKQVALNSVADEWQTTYDYIESCLIDYCGGYLRTRKETASDGTETIYLDWKESYFDTSSQTIEVGKNVLDLTEDNDLEDVFTALVPIGDENLTIEKAPVEYTAAGISASDPSLVGKIGHYKDSPMLINWDAYNKYGGRIVKTYVFDGVNDVNTLVENGKRYLRNAFEDKLTLTITAVDMHFIDSTIEKIRLGDRVKIISDPHDIDNTLTCTKIEYDLSNPANTVYTFGKPKQTLTDRYRKDKKKQDAANARGGGGGAAKAANKTAEKDLDEFFDAWINCDPSKGQVSLGALYENYKADQETLSQELGLKIDAKAGTLTQYGNRKTKLSQFEEDHAAELKYLETHLGITFDTKKAKMDIFADHEWTKAHYYIDENNKMHDELELFKNAVGLTIDAKNNKATLSSKVSQVLYDENGKRVGSVTKALAEIETWAGYDPVTKKWSSTVGINADVVKIGNWKSGVEDGVAKLVKVEASLTTISGYLQADGAFSAPSISGGTIWIGNGKGSTSITNHTHEITESMGKISIGNAMWGKDPQSFSIAATKAYKDGVAARTASSLRFGYTAGEIDYGKIIVNSSDKHSVTLPIYPDAYGNGYDDGYKNGKRDGINSFEAVTVYVQGNAVTRTLYYTYNGTKFYPLSGTYYSSGGTKTYYRMK